MRGWVGLCEAAYLEVRGGDAALLELVDEDEALGKLSGSLWKTRERERSRERKKKNEKERQRGGRKKGGEKKRGEKKSERKRVRSKEGRGGEAMRIRHGARRMSEAIVERGERRSMRSWMGWVGGGSIRKGGEDGAETRRCGGAKIYIKKFSPPPRTPGEPARFRWRRG